jgi:hypothetical protein
MKALTPGRMALQRQQNSRRANPKGRLDIAAYRVVSEHLLPFAERILGVPGLAEHLKPHAEYLIAKKIPPVNIFEAAPKPRRRLAP